MTHPQRERVADENIRRQGFETWLPRTADGPLFPRYLFVSIIDVWHVLLNTIGVSAVLRNGEQPAYVREDQWRELRARELKGVVVLPKRGFDHGQSVRIDDGIFFGEQGLYDGMPSEGRAWVLLRALGRIQIAEKHLSAI
jgi:transcription antitermination factor NusG